MVSTSFILLVYLSKTNRDCDIDSCFRTRHDRPRYTIKVYRCTRLSIWIFTNVLVVARTSPSNPPVTQILYQPPPSKSPGSYHWSFHKSSTSSNASRQQCHTKILGHAAQSRSEMFVGNSSAAFGYSLFNAETRVIVNMFIGTLS